MPPRAPDPDRVQLVIRKMIRHLLRHPEQNTRRHLRDTIGLARRDVFDEALDLAVRQGLIAAETRPYRGLAIAPIRTVVTYRVPR
jgi:hypothetical protein